MTDDDQTGKSSRTDTQEPFSAINSFVREHPAIIGSLIYLQVSAVGILYIRALLSKFGVNVFDYAEANDFLLAAFKQPLAFVMPILTYFVFAAALWKINARKKKQGKPYRHPWIFLAIIIACILIFTLSSAFLLGGCDANKIKQGKSGLVSLKLRGKLAEVDPLLPKGKLSLIGSTDKFLFFYSYDFKKCIVVPISNIGSLSIDVGNN